MATINTARIAALPDEYFADKKFTREDLANALRALADELESPAVAEALATPTLCLVPGRSGRCIKPRGHGQRHRYGTPPVSSPAPASTPEPAAVCGRKGPGHARYCHKTAGHAGQHRYAVRTAAARRAAFYPWVQVPTISVANEDGSRSYPVKIPGVCSVWDDDSHRRKTNGWTIISAEQHRETGVINVTVKQGRNGHARTVRLSRLVYRRPRGK